MDTIEIRSASVTDHDAVRSLLERSGLPTEDIREHLPHFSLLLHDDRLLGVVGLEVHGDLGLLVSRSTPP
jgi:N-acetylglutamate synthase-like GNAT family acetyltransferase